MQLQFHPRFGDYKNWSRSLNVKDDADNSIRTVVLMMLTETFEQTAERAKGRSTWAKFKDMFIGPNEVRTSPPPGWKLVRYGKIYPTTIDKGQSFALTDKLLWEGELSTEGAPGRAFAVASGLCDEEGNTNLPVPEWLL